MIENGVNVFLAIRGNIYKGYGEGESYPKRSPSNSSASSNVSSSSFSEGVTGFEELAFGLGAGVTVAASFLNPGPPKRANLSYSSAWEVRMWT